VPEGCYGVRVRRWRGPSIRVEVYSTHWPGMLSGNLDISIGTLACERPDFFARFDRVLVTCVDSVRAVATTHLARALLERFPGCSVMGDGVLVPGLLVTEVEAALGMFVGFDEVWCFLRSPEREKPPALSVLPPPGFDVAEAPLGVARWMVESGCQLALGDGLGMNYVTPDPSVECLLTESTT
jgi:hypothetical protein